MARASLFLLKARQPEEAERAMLTHLKNVEKLLSDVSQEPAGQSEPK
ncbi:hypothetical protein ACIQAS_10500 [Bacillus safensis]